MDYEENNRYVHDYEDSGQPIPSTKVGYDNTNSGLDATNVQGAIDEVAQILDEKQDKTYDGTESGIEATTVTGAIDELAQDISDLTDVVDNLDGSDIGYSGTTSGLSATTVQGAIDEIDNIVDNLDGSDIGYSGTTSGLSATTVQGAIDEIDSTVDNLDGSDIGYSGTTSGLSATTVQGAIDEIIAQGKARYHLVEMKDNHALASGKTYGEIASGLFGWIKNFISNLASDEIVDIIAVGTSTTTPFILMDRKFFKASDINQNFNYNFVFMNNASEADSDQTKWNYISNIISVDNSGGTVKRFIIKFAANGSEGAQTHVMQNLDALTSTRNVTLIYKLYKVKTS